jgi:mRNA interferase MazF
MEEPHDAWNELQKTLDRGKNLPFCKPREVWWGSIGMNIGAEIYGKHNSFERPLLILKVFGRELALVIPLSSQKKKSAYKIKVLINERYSYAVLSQARSISTKRLSRRIGLLDVETFEKIRDKYKTIV